jgi:uncharacterized protein
MENPKFVVFVGRDGQYYFRLQASNGETILQSEGYHQKSGATNGIASVKENAPSDNRYDRKISADKKYYFNLKAANNEIIGTSEMYNSEVARENGIQSVKTNAPVAPVDDQA